MTVGYTAEVASCRGFGCFVKLLFRWRGSIYKLIWPELILFLCVYFGLSGLYRFGLAKDQQVMFERVSRYCEKQADLIPVSFVLGFYVSIVVNRWWSQYRAIPWPDSIAVFVSSSLQSRGEKGRLLRRSIMRYVCLAQTMVFVEISPRVKLRFPSYTHLVEAGLMLENEKDIIEDMDRNAPTYSKYWLPMVWAGNLVTTARKEGDISADFAVKTIFDELNKFRSGLGLLTKYDAIPVPLVYTQVVTLAVYSYFLACVMGRQWLSLEDGSVKEVDLIFPVFTTLQFFFYVGWLKVAETLVNPFGDDDDDFELNWMVDRNLQVSYLIVDDTHSRHPKLLKDQYWDAVFPVALPHTVASSAYRERPPVASTSKLEVTKEEGEIVGSCTSLQGNGSRSVISVIERGLKEKEGSEGLGLREVEVSGGGEKRFRVRSVDVVEEVDENLTVMPNTRIGSGRSRSLRGVVNPVCLTGIAADDFSEAGVRDHNSSGNKVAFTVGEQSDSEDERGLRLS